MADAITAELDYAGDDDGLRYGIPVFDNLAPAQKLALLEQVLRQLLTPTESPPTLTAMNEGAVAAIYAAIGQMVVSEIEMESELEEMVTCDGQHWRKLLLDVAQADGYPSSELPAASCLIEEKWECLLDSIAARVLWDDDYMDTEALLDATPDSARRYRRKLGIERDYFVAIAPDPKEAEIAALSERLKALCRDGMHEQS